MIAWVSQHIAMVLVGLIFLIVLLLGVAMRCLKSNPMVLELPDSAAAKAFKEQIKKINLDVNSPES